MRYFNTTKHNYPLTILLVLLLQLSCADLEENPIGLSSPLSFYKTPEQCEAVYAGSMNALFQTWGGYQFPLGLPDGQNYGSDLNFTETSFNDYWAWHYKAISNINPVIKAIKENSLEGFPQDVINDVEGQGKFLRAFNYFYLVRLYGKIPYLDETTPDPVSTPLTPESRLEIEEVYTKIVADLQFAADNLFDYDGSAPGKPNKWMAKAMLSKVYLTMATAPLNKAENYAKALDVADDVIVNGPYKLEQDLNSIFNTSNRQNLEMIFAFYSTYSVETGAEYMPGNVWAPSEWEGWSGGAVIPTWLENFPQQPRRKAYVLEQWISNIYDPSSSLIDWQSSADGVPYVQKFNYPNLTLEEQVGGGPSGIEMPILRYPDVLLIYAEAANMANNGPTQLAVDRINAVIERANGGPGGPGEEPLATITMSKEAFDAKVIEERNFELCFEGDRYFDVLRKRLLEQVNLPDNAQGFDENDYLLPIPPIDALKIGQNQGY
ncbi:MAG: RagB/SusD family nutrient uptake outer membrane protein [Saprospiraceae bacterium]|nr:RagB/SusD family nutrient uptake outer membrane protein [Saprospiraceae bacterium]